MNAQQTPPSRVLVVIPTYNELQNLPIVTGAVQALPAVNGRSIDILVVDDGSPDGTGELADRLAAEHGELHVLHRITKDGLGRAYLAGFAWAIAHDYDVVVEMDADGSHPPESLPALLDVLARRPDVGLVIGSRWIPGGRLVDWGAARQWLSRGGNRYARTLLQLPVHDCTAGYRAYRTSVLAGIDLDDVHSHGYCFQIEMTLRVRDARVPMVEVPIVFRDRIAGTSKMSKSIVAEAMLRVTYWGLLRALRSARHQFQLRRA
ncbi:polyprenol monophosphomannose synthase [Naasia lichenicola]|uniref:polyprenol monophosphomannose synthase n=1 Tax=Naasia lichenicola TaxID=2565933 RepID=UPI001E497B3C|nr:polyprenol monophosphomannose synthase [Naasia lichenicola]